MSESQNNQRPVRKLTVKNFSVIKDAELEFNQITVLIGPQASGKSLLCKLAYFLTKQLIENALISILSPNPNDSNGQGHFNEFTTSLGRDFLAWFPLETWRNKDARVTFDSLAFRVDVSLGVQPDSVEFEFSPEFRTLFGSLLESVQQTHASGAESRKHLTEQVRAQFNLLITGFFVDRPLYVPDGRAFFASQSLGFNAVSNPEIDPLLREFSLELSWGSPRSPNPILGEEGVRILHAIQLEMIRIAGGSVEGRNGSVRFRRALDSRSIPIPLLSSGTQALLPMLNVLWQLIVDQRSRIIFPRPDNLHGTPNQIIESRGLIYLEEPEANLFPSTQFELVRLFGWLSQERRLNFAWVITTHSPYVLSVFADLVKAGKVGVENGENRAAVNKVIPEKYWIRDGDFSAYKIEDGKLASIFDKETGQIDGDYLDNVSGKISDELGQLLEIQYGKS